MNRRGKLLITKQKRLIATRLVQISLLVDDYVYHGKPMSARSADAYMREITAFKDKCYQDVRSLQVIEKLTRFMKEIIEEQQEIHGQPGTEDFTFTYNDSLNKVPLSPVYSIAEEDTQYLEELKENDKETVPDQLTTKEDNDTQTTTDARDHIGTDDIKVIDLCDDENVQVSNDDTLFPKYLIVDKDSQNINDIIKELDRDSLPNKIVTDEKKYTKTAKVATDAVVNMEVLDLCCNDIAEALKDRSINGFHNEEFNMQRALSNLSIRDFEEVFEVPFSQECSQSILDNYYPLSIANGIGTPLTQNNASTAIVTQRPETDKVVFNDKTIKIALPQKNNQLNIKPTTIKNIKNMQTGHKISKPRTQKPSNTRNKNKTPSLLETVATNFSDSVTIKKCTAKVTSTKPKAQKQKNVKAETGTKQFINEYKNYIDTVQQPNITQIANQYAPSEKGNRTHFDHPKHLQTTTIKIGEKFNVLINNSFVVNDLSWIENIRFVRVIPSEEYESLIEGKDFWKNSTFPQNYNEEDFNY